MRSNEDPNDSHVDVTMPPSVITVDAHVEQLLQSTDTLTEAEIQAPTTSLQKLDNNNVALKERALEDRADPAQMNDAQRVIEAYMLRHKAVLHPIHSIPDDVLRTIFECCTFSSENRPILDVTNPPWNLSYVSHGWRALALTSPRLWSKIYIASFEIMYCNITPLVHRLSTIILRSADCDLYVHIEAEEPVGNERLLECLQILGPSSNRWETLVVRVNEPLLLELVAYTGGSFLHLRNVKLTLSEPPTVSSQTGTIRFDAPCTSSLWLGGVAIDLDFPGAWDTITYYSCDTRHIKYLSVLASLRTLCIEQTGDWSSKTLPGDSTQPLMTLPTVEALFVTQNEHFHSARELAPSFAHFPSLNTLGFIFHSYMSPFPTFEGSIDRIQTIFVDYTNPCRESSGPLIAFLAQCRGLTSVYLGKYIVNKKLLEALEVIDTDDRTTILLPNLRSLGVHAYTMHRFQMSMTNVVSARYQGRGDDIAPLTKLKIVCDESEKEETVLPPLIGERINVVYQTYWDYLENLGYRFMEYSTSFMYQ